MEYSAESVFKAYHQLNNFAKEEMANAKKD